MGWVYILANRPRGVLYVGVTSDLVGRIYQHRVEAVPGFTQKYQLKQLVYFEELGTMPLAIQREKNIKHWPRQWKIDLIEGRNPTWRDLWFDIAR